MVKYILKRLGLAVIILLGVSLIIYFLVRMMPYDYVEKTIAALNTAAFDEGAIKAMYEAYGLSDSSFLGILKGYGKWLWGLLRFDLGTSFVYSEPVIDVIVKYMGVSFMVSFISIILEFLVAIPLGITAATHQYSFRDYLVTVLVMIGISLPSFFFGQMLKDLFSLKLGWLPPSGLIDASQNLGGLALLGDYIRHLILPLLTMTVISIGGRMRYTRTNMLEVLSADYIRTARAKGLPESKVIYKHAFRNTLIPLVTTMAAILPTLFSGAMITEQVFDLPGIGNMAYKAMMNADIPFMMGYNMFLALLSVIGVLLADLMYAVVDPRVKLA